MADKTQDASQTRSKWTVDTGTREYLNYSQRCAYRALKRVTRNKDLDFKPKVWQEASVESRASTDRSIADTDDESDTVESESPESGTRSSESPSFRDVQRRLRETWGRKEQGAKLLRSGSDKSSMMPARSLAKSAFSAKFAKYEVWRSRSENVLDSIPRMLCFRRKKSDKCLSCMYKSLRKANEARIPSRAQSEARDDDKSSSDGFPEFYEELRELYLQRRAIPRRLKKIEDSDGATITALHQVENKEEEEEEEEKEEEADVAMKIEPDESESATPQPAATLLSKSPKSLKAASSSISILSKVSSSDAHTSDDGMSSSPVMDLDRSQYKRMAPCHLPTVLVPSMEPLRALRHRKPTTMEARIALLERSAEQKSDDEYRDDVKSSATARTPGEKSQRRRVDGGSEMIGKEDASLKSPKVLMKVRSEERLMLTIAESPAQREKLKRGYSCASIGDLSRDPTRGTLGFSRGEAGSGRGEAISSEAVDSGLAPSGSIGAERRPELPLLTVAEISRFLTGANLGEAGSAASALESLADEFSARLTKQRDTATTTTMTTTMTTTTTTAAMRRAKLAARLTKLLAQSKRYLNPDKFPSDLVFSAQQPPVFNTRLLRCLLPLESYNLIAPLLGMQAWYPKRRIRRRKTELDEEKEEDVEEDVESVPTNLSILVRIMRGDVSRIIEF